MKLENINNWKYSHFKPNEKEIITNISISEFIILNKQWNIELASSDGYHLESDYFVMTWANYKDPVHFIVFQTALVIINGEQVYKHIQGMAIESCQQGFYKSIHYLIEELEQITSGLSFDVMGIEDLIDVLSSKESQDLLLRIQQSQLMSQNLKNSVKMKKVLLQRCAIPFYNSITALMLLEDKLNHSYDDLSIFYNHYISELNTSISISSHQVNLVTRKLVILTIIGLVLTVIAAAFGMNAGNKAYGVPFNDYNGSWYYIAVMSVLISGMVGMSADKMA